MGIVWQARDTLLGRDVAVKALAGLAHLPDDEQRTACRRAVREARATAQLTHRNIIRVYDILEEDGCPWIVMELLTPRSLRDLVHEDGPLDPPQAARMGLEVLAALRAAHALGIVHRDVKPANILMPGDRAVLVDFGIAQAAAVSADITTVSQLIGSPAYVAPERARGLTAGPPADLWGLGASLYAAVEGSGPFERQEGALASLAAVIADEPEPAAHAGPLWPVISGLLRKDPAERLGAAEAERLLRLAAVPAPWSDPASDAVTRTRRPPTRVAVLAGSAVLAVAVTATTVTLLSQPGQVPHPATAAATPATTAPQVRPARAHPSASSPRHTAGQSDGTQLTSRTSPTPATPGGPRSPVATQPGPPGVGQPAESAKPVKPTKPTKPGKPPKPSQPGKPPKGNGKGKG